MEQVPAEVLDPVQAVWHRRSAVPAVVIAKDAKLA